MYDKFGKIWKILRKILSYFMKVVFLVWKTERGFYVFRGERRRGI